MRVLKFYSETCGPCKILEKNLQEANIPHESINIELDENEDLLEKYQIRSVPTLVFINNHKVENISVYKGLKTVEEIKDLYAKHLEYDE